MSSSPLPGADPAELLDLWWVLPGVLAGMPMPFVHPERRARCGGPLEAYPDELPTLYAVGVRAVVCLLPIAGDGAVYRSAGFGFHLLAMMDGGVPTLEEFRAFVSFVDTQRGQGQAVAVHCEAGLGRTGTVVAGYLMAAEGASVEAAVARVRAVRPGAIETGRQVRFLHELGGELRG